MTALTKKEIAREIKDIRADIASLVKGIDPLLKPHKISSDLLRAAIKEYNSAKSAMEKKDSAKAASRLEKATTELFAAYGTYLDTATALNDHNNNVLLKYTRLFELSEAVSDREVAKAKRECDTYKEEYEIRLSKVERGVSENLPAVLTEAPDASEVAEGSTDSAFDTPMTEEAAPATEPAPAPIRPVAGATVASVNVAPVTIDISTYVERAISATMERLSVGMEKRITAYVDSLVIPAPAPVAISTTPVTPADVAADTAATDAFMATTRANNELMTHLLEEQTHIYEKLRTMISNVQGLVDGMTDLSAAYLSLAEKEREAIEIQKQVNDMQRHTAREQQGVKVNQKMIAEEQIAISAEQSLLADRQKATMDRQSTLLESQRSMEETQKALVETHHALEEAMRAVMQAQKEIIATQQSIINGNAKNVDAQKLLMEKQAEITALQKEALAAQRQLQKEQKAHNEKLLGKSPRPKKPADTDSDEPPVLVDGPVVTEKAAPATDVSSLSADDEFRD